ncbi:MAG: hypothetical protein AMXMBFR13_50940 [Phycisphaerae bacterium]
MTNRKREVAKFFCGFEVFHTLFHGYLWLSGTTFTAFGITATHTWNVASVVVHGAIAVVLGFYAWWPTDAQRPDGLEHVHPRSP